MTLNHALAGGRRKAAPAVEPVGQIEYMTIEELVEEKSLEKVKVQRPLTDVIEAGNKKFIEVFKNFILPIFPQRMRGANCQSNSICVVEAMREKGEDDWHVVPGFAFKTETERPVIHVWVRKKKKHYDPSWIWHSWKRPLRKRPC